jgi:hypothetical protein
MLPEKDIEIRISEKKEEIYHQLLQERNLQKAITENLLNLESLERSRENKPLGIFTVRPAVRETKVGS